MAWIMILERGYGYCTASIKGLELQETSCHTIEAARIEDTFEATFEKENGVPFCSFHPHPLDTLKPCDAANIQTYSDAKNVLTGVIDSPDALQKVADGFAKCLVWVLLHHNYKRNKTAQQSCKHGDEVFFTNGRPPSAKSAKSNPSEKSASVKAWKKLDNKGSTPSLEEAVAKLGGDSGEWESQIDFTAKTNKEKGEKVPTHVKKVHPIAGDRPQSAKSFSDSIWSSDSLAFDTSDTKTKNKINLTSALSASRSKASEPTPLDDDIPGLLSEETEPIQKKPQSKKKIKKSQVGCLDDSSLFGDFDFGLPAMDINQKPPVRLPPLFGKENESKANQFRATDVTTVEPAVEYGCVHSGALRPPDAWREIPVEASKLEKFTQSFPLDWYKHVLRCLSLSDGTEDVAEQVSGDKIFESAVSKVKSYMNLRCLLFAVRPEINVWVVRPLK